MIKRLLAVLVLACVVCGVMCACEKKISADEAVAIVLEDLGIEADEAESPHVHTGEYRGQSCYNIYITVGHNSYVYYVSVNGAILYSGIGSHSH